MVPITFISGSVESSSTWTMIRSDGHESPQAAPMESLYTWKTTHEFPNRENEQRKERKKETFLADLPLIEHGNLNKHHGIGQAAHLQVLHHGHPLVPPLRPPPEDFGEEAGGAHRQLLRDQHRGHDQAQHLGELQHRRHRIGSNPHPYHPDLVPGKARRRVQRRVQRGEDAERMRNPCREERMICIGLYKCCSKKTISGKNLKGAEEKEARYQTGGYQLLTAVERVPSLPWAWLVGFPPTSPFPCLLFVYL